MSKFECRNFEATLWWPRKFRLASDKTKWCIAWRQKVVVRPFEYYDLFREFECRVSFEEDGDEWITDQRVRISAARILKLVIKQGW